MLSVQYATTPSCEYFANFILFSYFFFSLMKRKGCAFLIYFAFSFLTCFQRITCTKRPAFLSVQYSTNSPRECFANFILFSYFFSSLMKKKDYVSILLLVASLHVFPVDNMYQKTNLFIRKQKLLFLLRLYWFPYINSLC